MLNSYMRAALTDGRRREQPWLQRTSGNHCHRLLKPTPSLIRAPSLRIAEIGEPLDLGRHVGEPVKLDGSQRPVGGSDLGGNLIGHHGRVIIEEICYQE